MENTFVRRKVKIKGPVIVPDLGKNPLCLFAAVPVVHVEHFSVKVVSSVLQFYVLRCFFNPGVEILCYRISFKLYTNKWSGMES